MVTHGEIAQALEKALEEAGEKDGSIDYSQGATNRELAGAMGVSISAMRLRLRRAIELGVVEYGGKARRISELTGENVMVPVYRLKLSKRD